MESYAVNSYKQGMSRTSSLERSTRVSCRFKEVPGVALAPAACKRKGRNFRSGQENGNESESLQRSCKRALPKMPRHEGFRVSLVPRTQTDDR